MICQPFERFELSVLKKNDYYLSAVQTARAIRLKKFVSRLNSSSYPFKRKQNYNYYTIVDGSNGSSYQSKKVIIFSDSSIVRYRT